MPDKPVQKTCPSCQRTVGWVSRCNRCRKQICNQCLGNKNALAGAEMYCVTCWPIVKKG